MITVAVTSAAFIASVTAANVMDTTVIAAPAFVAQPISDGSVSGDTNGGTGSASTLDQVTANLFHLLVCVVSALRLSSR